jgi:hypothetical protein
VSDIQEASRLLGFAEFNLTKGNTDAALTLIKKASAALGEPQDVPENGNGDFGTFSNGLPAGYEPIEVVIRHPDCADDFYSWGLNHRTIYLDLGSSFDITRIGPSDKATVEEWVEGVLDEIKDLPEDHPARETIDETIANVREALA